MSRVPVFVDMLQQLHWKERDQVRQAYAKEKSIIATKNMYGKWLWKAEVCHHKDVVDAETEVRKYHL